MGGCCGKNKKNKALQIDPQAKAIVQPLPPKPIPAPKALPIPTPVLLTPKVAVSKAVIVKGIDSAAGKLCTKCGKPVMWKHRYVAELGKYIPIPYCPFCA